MNRFVVFTDSGTYAPLNVARIVDVDDDEGFAELSDGERNTLALLHGNRVVDVADRKSGQGVKVYTLTYSHKHGEDVSVYATEKAAEKSIEDIVNTYWEELFPELDPATVPADERVDQYFDVSGEESCSIEECEVQGLDEDSALTLFNGLRRRFGWSGAVFVEGDITGMLDPDMGLYVDPKTGEPLSAERLAAITPAVVEAVQNGYAWRKAMQDRLAEIGNEILSDAVGEVIDEVLRG